LARAGRRPTVISTPSKSNRWRELLEEFRALGGTAENICIGEGRHGRGLFVEDASRPVRLRAPENLLLPLEAACFHDGTFFVAPTSGMTAREKAWLERYENEFSWGGRGRRETEAWLESISALPGEIREKLATKFSMPHCTGDLTAESVQQRFLESRVIEHNGRKVIMPIVELINHHSGAPTYDGTSGVAISGKFPDEVLASYCEADAFGYFQKWSFLSEATMAFSMWLTLHTLVPEVQVARELLQGKLYGPNGPAGISLRLPNLIKDKDRIKLSFLMLGNRNSPRIPRGAFHRVFQLAGLQAADEMFDVIRHMNGMLFLGLLGDIEGLAGPFAAALRTVCRFQLEALAHCFGMREI
jgi:hypothetical protein